MARRTAFALAALALVAVVLAASSPRSVAQTAVAGVITGPTALAPRTSSSYFLNATGGPGLASGGNYSIRYYLSGSDLTDGGPLPSSPSTMTNSTGAFTLNVTAPAKEQGISLIVELNSSFGTTYERTTLTYAITVVTPVILTATFANDGKTAALNVLVRFYVDGKLVGQATIPRIEPGATGTATLSYLPAGLGAGSHTVLAQADINGNGVIEPDKGEVVVLDVFYKKGWELTWGYAILIILLTISLTVLIVRWVRRRRR